VCPSSVKFQFPCTGHMSSLSNPACKGNDIYIGFPDLGESLPRNAEHSADSSHRADAPHPIAGPRADGPHTWRRALVGTELLIGASLHLLSCRGSPKSILNPCKSRLRISGQHCTRADPSFLDVLLSSGYKVHWGLKLSLKPSGP
jgi:hypothetical protein